MKLCCDEIICVFMTVGTDFEVSEMQDVGHGLQVVSVTDTHSFILEESVLRQLLLREDVRDLPVVVVSVAGAYRGGKSFLLNFFIRYLSASAETRADGSWLGEDSAPLAGFQWRSGIKATTMGILMWSEPFITTLPSGEKVAILLVDTQGTFDSKSTLRDNSTIFALSTLLSSIQIYNLSHDIKEDDLQHLELFTEYGKLVNTSDSNEKAFQVLEFLVRDWQFPDDDYPFGGVGGECLLQEKLKVTEHMAEEMVKLREHIRSSFEKVSAFLMPHPGFKVLSKKFKGEIKDIDPEFRTQLTDLVNSLFGPSKLLPKTINGQKIKAQHLFNYFKGYMELFNKGDIPSPENIMVVTVRAGLLSAVDEARSIYEKGMDAECGPKQPLSLPPSDVKFLHTKYVKLATDDFSARKKMGSKKEHKEYLDKLTKEIDQRLEQFLQSNLSKVQVAEKKAHEAYDQSIQNISKGQPFCIHPVDLEKVHNDGVKVATNIYDASRKRITDAYDEERDKFIQSFKKEYDLLRRTNEQNNDMFVTQLKMEYWQYMQSKATLENPLTDVEFKNEHNEGLENALKNFKNKRNMPNNYNEDVYTFRLVEGINDNFINLKAINKSKNKAAMNAGIEAYDTYIRDHWDKMTQCLHPDDFEELHRMAKCHGFEVFHPQKQCSEGFDENDEDEITMKDIMKQRYNDAKKNNDNKNETAVLLAYNEYVRSMDDRCKFNLWWLLIVPYFVHKNKRPELHETSKQQAMSVFYSNRRSGSSHASDPFKQRAEEMIEEYYQKNYK